MFVVYIYVCDPPCVNFCETLRQESQRDKLKAISSLGSQYLGCVQVGREQGELTVE